MNAEYLDNIIKTYCSGSILKCTNVTPCGFAGENFASVLYNIDLKIQNTHGQVENYRAILKMMPTNKVQQDVFNSPISFYKELGWYTTVLTAIQQFLRNSGSNMEMDFFPQFYGGRLSLHNTETKFANDDTSILLENLKESGYNIIDKRIGFDLETTKHILKNLAVFHAVPIAIKQKNQHLFLENISPYLINDTLDTEPYGFQQLHSGYISVIEKSYHLRQFLPKIEECLRENMFSVKIKREPWCTIVHDDFWSNNILIKQIDNEIKAKFIDMQTITQGSAASDLFLFLMTSVQQLILEPNLDDLIKFYYNEIINDLKQLNVPTNLFSYTSLLNEIKMESKSGMFARCMCQNAINLSDKKNVKSVSSPDYNFYTEYLEMASQVTQQHVEKYTFLTLKCIEKGWI